MGLFDKLKSRKAVTPEERKLKNIQEYLINTDKIKLRFCSLFTEFLLSSHNIIHNIFCRIRIIIVFKNFYD